MKTYDKYKDSGIEWIGEIPEHWEISTLKYYLKEIISGGTPTSDNPNFWTESNDGINWVNIADITESEGVLKHTKNKITEDGRRSKNLRILETGTLLFSIFASLGKTTFLETNACINQAIVGLLPKEKLSVLFLNYYLIMLERNILYYSSSNTQSNLNLEKVRNFKLIVPPFQEQTAIANYLDQKTTEIDQLITDKRRLLALYEEEKTAIINQAVTKGINPDVKMKGSGIEWLGEIPEHWEVKRLKYVATINPRKNQSFKNLVDNVVFLPMEKVNEDGSFDDELQKPVGELWNAYTYFESGDLIIAKITPCFENGKGALLSNLKTAFGFGSTEFHVIRPRLVMPQLLFYLTRSSRFMKVGEASMVGAAGQKRVPTDFMSEFFIVFPSLEEQQTIVHYIETEAARIDAKISKTEKLIELLEEYRVALISEVVTGKVKVCG